MSVDADSVAAACDLWFTQAYREWSTLAGEQLAYTLPKFVWRPAAGSVASPFAGAYSHSAFWRVLSRRIDECSHILDNRRPGGVELVARHVNKMVLASGQSDVPQASLAEARKLIEAAFTSIAGADTIALRRLAAIAAQKGRKLEQSASSAKSTAWRCALAAPSEIPAAGPAMPSKLAYRWLRGDAGWTKSPVGEQWQNDCTPDEQLLDEAPAHLIQPVTERPRIWSQPADTGAAVLSDQADVEAEADFWGELWDEHQQYDAVVDPFGTDALKPMLPWAIRQASLSFPCGTGLGAENIAPRAFARLSDELLTALCVLLTAIELLGVWPRQIVVVLIVLLPKADGGAATHRPVSIACAPLVAYQGVCGTGLGGAQPQERSVRGDGHGCPARCVAGVL